MWPRLILNQRFGVKGLETVFDPDQMGFLERTEQVEDIRTCAVRTGPNGQARYSLILQGFPVQPIENRQRRVGIGKRLKIGDEFFCPVAPFEKGLALPHLVANARQALGRPASGSLPVAIDAPARPFRSVPVRTGQAGIQGDFMDPAAEQALQVPGVLDCIKTEGTEVWLF